MNQTRLLLTIGLASCLIWLALSFFRRPVPVAVHSGSATNGKRESGGKENGPATLQGTQARENLEQTSDGQSLMAQRGISASLVSASARPLHENHLGGRSSDFNQWLDSLLDSTTSSPGISDLMASVRARSTARVESPQRNGEDREEEARGDQPDEAVRFRNIQLQDEDGEIPIDELQKAREQMNLMLDAQQKKAVASGKPDGLDVAGIDPGSWAWLGPGNIGGRIRSIVIDPVDPNQLAS